MPGCHIIPPEGCIRLLQCLSQTFPTNDIFRTVQRLIKTAISSLSLVLTYRCLYTVHKVDRNKLGIGNSA